LYAEKKFILDQRADRKSVYWGLDTVRTAKKIKRAADSQKK